MNANERTARPLRYYGIKVEDIYQQDEMLKETTALFISYGHHILRLFLLPQKSK